jgi:hypothetical protein
MPCDTSSLPGQTLTERKTEILDAVKELTALLVSGRVKPKIGAQGGIAFEGWTDSQRRRVTDACAYRRIMATGSSLAKAKIAQAEMMSGRRVNAQAVGAGVHSHDGGLTWHDHRG